MRSVLSCALLSVSIACASKAFAVDYCPLQLQAQSGNNYYYYCQTKQGTNCTYTYTQVGQPYQCGGCCDDCCTETCVGQFSKLLDEATIKKSAAARSAATAAKFEDTEVVPVRDLSSADDKGESYITRDERCCTPGTCFTVDEVWLHVDINGTTYYFRCFDVTNKDRPREKLRIGRQLTKDDWDKGPVLNASAKRNADHDAGWAHSSKRFHRVKVHDTVVDANDDRPFYLISAVDIQ